MLINEPDYLTLLTDIKSQIEAARQATVRAMNTGLVVLYWNIGRVIDERSEWGNKFIETLARDIRTAYPDIRGFSVRNLKYMVRFAREYPDLGKVQPLVALLPWASHLVLLDKVRDPLARGWYIEQAAANHWSKRGLMDRVEHQVYERQALPSKTTNFDERLPELQAEQAAETLRDPYLFDFVSYRHGMVEREIENELVRHITEFLIELGTGFAFVGQQYRIEVEGEDFYIDLLFYHIKLRCYIVIELKAGRFKPEYAGKLNFYVSAVDAQVADASDNPTIGLLLCRDKGGLVAEYAFKDINKPIGVSEYQLLETLPELYENLLPSVEDIRTRMSLPEDEEDESWR